MSDVTRNIFYWFRGASDDERASRRQLENNLTKSLVTILEHCDRKAVLGALVKRLGLWPCARVVFSLQRKPDIVGTVEKRIVLGITGGETELARTPPKADAGRPDAWICGDGWTVLIEGKIGAELGSGQIAAHARAAGWRRGTYDVAYASWHELHHMFKSAKVRIPAKDRVSHLLLANWLSYLEHQNMTEFERLEPIDFDFPNMPEEERRVLLPHIKRRLRAFAEELAGRAPAKRIARLYARRGVNQWKFGEPSAASGRGMWFNIGGDPSPQTWHATVFYQPHGLAVTVLNSENHLARRLCKAGIDGFRHIVEMAGEAEGVLVGCRRAWYYDPKSPYKGQQIEKADEPVVVEAHALDSGSRDDFAVMLRKTMERLLRDKRWRTELHVRKDVPCRQLLRLPLDAQVALIAKAVDNAYPILQYLLRL